MSSAPAGVEERAVNVQVAVRCRPANEEERKGGQPLVISTNQDKRTVDVSYGSQSKKQSKTYSFDKVFGAYSTQEEVFESVVSPIVQECLAGFNCTIFAYGQTGTGKTHTMEGSIHCEENAGIVPRSIKKIFDTLTSGGAEFTVRVSFLELYNEELQDLLTPTGAATTGDKKLKLCEVEKKGVVVQNLEEVTVLNANDIFEILQKGIQQRATAATNMNKNSSRSHSIFTMKIMIKEQQVDGEEVVRHGQLNLVDLAGSECVGRSGAKNDRAREAGNINQSLLTLGRVITALVDHHGHIPYRDSKLTRLLQESLGGKAKTCIIATLSPSHLAVEETMSTLDYAHKAKNIKNQPLVNQRMTKKTVLKEYCEEIESLRSQLQLTREKNGVYVEPEKFYAMEQRIASQEMQIAEVEQVLKSKQEEHKAMKAERDAIQSKVTGLEECLADTSSRLHATESSLQQKTQALAEEEAENRANQCVIAEQVASEKGLALEGASLQADLVTQRSARVALMSKVESLSEREARRTDEASEFVDGVVGSSRSLCSEVDGMLSACDAQSAALCGGVAQMLSKGKATCEALNKDIGAALADLVENTSIATDSMAGKCTSVEVGLDSAKGDVVAALHGMQRALSSWLGEVESAMQDTAKSLQEQEAVVTQTREHLRAHEASLEKFMNDAAAAEAVHRADKARHFQSLQENIRLALVEQKAEASKLDAQLVSSLESRTSSIQATLGEALAHLVSDTKSLLKGHLEEASLRAQGTSDLVVNGLHEDEAKWSRFVEGQDNLRAGALTSSRNFAASASGDMDSISDRKRRAETLIGKGERCCWGEEG
jgi:kinesin family protein 11